MTRLNVGFLIMIFTVATVACQQDVNSQKTVIQNVKGYTFYDGELRQFSAISFNKGKVEDVYSEGSFEPDESYEIIDGEGKIMLPGLIDAHGHVMGLGYQQMDADLTGSSSLDEALERVDQYAAEYPELNWIRGRGWNHTHWDINRFPTAEELDEAENERPIWLTRVDGHAGWANSKAMEIAGISSDSESPEGGKIIRDENGEPTGVFIDAAMRLVTSKMPERSSEERQMALDQALQQMNKHGLTGVHDAGVDTETWELYKAFADQGRMSTRIYGMISGAGATFDELSEQGIIHSYDQNRLALRSVKLYADGALGSRGAALIEDYSDDPGNRGLLFSPEEELTEQIHKAASKGYQVNVHAIGDRANRVALDAFEQVRENTNDQDNRHRIEHAQIIAPDDIPRFKELDIIASMQPTHATSDMNMAEDRIGSERIRGGYAWQTLLEQGTRIAGGSDFPVEHVNPFYGLYSAITRQNHEGEPPTGWYPEERLTREQAFRAFTLDAAYAGHQEDLVGSLEPGKWADFIMIDRDLFEVPANEIWQTKVVETWLAGEQVFAEDKN